jgi:hypothetical protein
MPSNAYRDRVFPPAEVRRILRHAAELDEVEQAPGDTGRGHTLEEIERIAGDAGITEAALRRAIAGEVRQARAPRRRFLFVPAHATLSVEQTARGAVHAARHEELARAIRRAIGVPGEARSAGEALGWSSSAIGGRKVHAIVEPTADGRVTVRVDEDLRSLRGTIFSGSLAVGLLLFLPIIALVSHEGAPYALLGWLFVGYLAAWIQYERVFAAREAQLRALVDEVVSVVTAPGARVAADDEALGEARIASQEEPEDEERADEAKGPSARRRQR